jgi:hypothetical protein
VRVRLAGLVVVLLAAVTAGCDAPDRSHVIRLHPIAAVAPFDHVLYWNSVLLQAFRAAGGPPTTLARAGAVMHVAIYDAVNSLTPIGTPYLARYTGGGTVESVIDRAAYDSLRAVFPGRDFTSSYLGARDGLPIGLLADQDNAGAQSAAAVVARRFDDGASNPTPYAATQAPGHWRPTGSGEGASPNWGHVLPWTMQRADQFRPLDPNGFHDTASLLRSKVYADQVNEVSRLGRSDSTVRTPDQTQLARFWAEDLDGTVKPPGQLYLITQTIAANHHLTQAQNARLFALVALGMADATIVAWDRKYDGPYALWRPQSAIQLADTDDNSATVADRSWQPLSSDYDDRPFTPPFPSYTSGHSTLGGAWSAVLAGFFGTDQDNFVGSTDDPHCQGCARVFTSYSQAGFEDAISRVFLGVHYRWDVEQGFASGHALGEWVVSRYLLPPR